MRRHQLGLVLLIVASLCFSHAAILAQTLAAPEGEAGATYNAAFPITMQVDGDFSDWAHIPYATVDHGTQPMGAAAQVALEFAAVADANNLYISAQVTDSQIVAGVHGINYFNEDSVEIYINATGNLSLASYASGVAQITLPAANIGKAAAQTVVAGINSEALGVRSVTVQTPTGYAIEAAIPLHTDVWDITPGDGERIGFQIDLNSASQADRDVKLIWSNADPDDQSYQNPNVFGQLVFYPIEGESVPVLPATTTPAPAATPTSEAAVTQAPLLPGAGFTVQGSTILDPYGNPFVVKGTNINGFNWTWSREVTQDADLIIQCWKFNLVRVNSFLFTGQIPYPQYDTNNDLDAIIETFTSRGIVVVLEGHDRIGSYYTGNNLTTLVNWFTDLAIRYRDNPYVWFDVMNEPGSRTELDAFNWVNTHGEVIKAIRDTAEADNMIIVEGAYGGQDAGNPDAAFVNTIDSAILSLNQEVLNYNGRHYDNIAFSIHTYDLWNDGDAKMADFFDRVQAQNLALIIGEYGVYTDQNTQPAAQSLFNTAPSRGVGRIVWQWDGSDYNDLTQNTLQGGGWEIDDCQQPTNLSWLGQQVWNDNHAN